MTFLVILCFYCVDRVLSIIIIIVIIIIIIKRKDLGGVMSKDCKDTVQTLKTVTKRDCDANELIE